jgi:hypothetical protein
MHKSSRSGTDLFELAVNQSEHFVGFEVSGGGGRWVGGNLPASSGNHSAIHDWVNGWTPHRID